MKLISKSIALATSSIFIAFSSSNAAPRINPMIISRNAFSQSIRRVSSHSSLSFSSSSSSSSSFPNDDCNIDEWYDHGCDNLLHVSSNHNDNDSIESEKEVMLCSATAASLNPLNNPLVKNLARGAFLRVASDITGGTALENIKCRVTATDDGPIQATRNIINSNSDGFLNLWSGTPSRTIEGALLGGIFLVASAATKKQVFAMGAGKNVAALAGGIVGGVAQAVIMTPAGLVFTSLNVNKGKPGYENDTAFTVAKRIINEKGMSGMYVGGGPMATRQASNWASRSLFTELCRTNLRLSRFGLVGEIGSGVIGGIGSCWNTPIETVRVLMQKDASEGLSPKTFNEYINGRMEVGGVPSLFCGVTPRAVQAIWQTVFMVVVPNLLGL